MAEQNEGRVNHAILKTLERFEEKLDKHIKDSRLEYEVTEENIGRVMENQCELQEDIHKARKAIIDSNRAHKEDVVEKLGRAYGPDFGEVAGGVKKLVEWVQPKPVDQLVGVTEMQMRCEDLVSIVRKIPPPVLKWGSKEDMNEFLRDGISPVARDLALRAVAGWETSCLQNGDAVNCDEKQAEKYLQIAEGLGLPTLDTIMKTDYSRTHGCSRAHAVRWTTDSVGIGFICPCCSPNSSKAGLNILHPAIFEKRMRNTAEKMKADAEAAKPPGRTYLDGDILYPDGVHSWKVLSAFYNSDWRKWVYKLQSCKFGVAGTIMSEDEIDAMYERAWKSVDDRTKNNDHGPRFTKGEAVRVTGVCLSENNHLVGMLGRVVRERVDCDGRRSYLVDLCGGTRKPVSGDFAKGGYARFAAMHLEAVKTDPKKTIKQQLEEKGWVKGARVKVNDHESNRSLKKWQGAIGVIDGHMEIPPHIVVKFPGTQLRSLCFAPDELWLLPPKTRKEELEEKGYKVGARVMVREGSAYWLGRIFGVDNMGFCEARLDDVPGRPFDSMASLDPARYMVFVKE